MFIKEEGRGSTELFWNPSREVRGQRLKRHTVLLEEQTELESERLARRGPWDPQTQAWRGWAGFPCDERVPGCPWQGGGTPYDSQRVPLGQLMEE